MSTPYRPAVLAVALILALAGRGIAADLRVIRVADGDTFTGLDGENRQIEVRLHGIDAPESRQSWGTVARKALADFIADRMVSDEDVDRDRYGRVVARLTIGGKLLNYDMVRSGPEWRYFTCETRNEFGCSRTTPAGNTADWGLAPILSPPRSGGRRRRTARRPGRPWAQGGRVDVGRSQKPPENLRPTVRVFVAGFQKIGGRGVGSPKIGHDPRNPMPSRRAPPEVLLGGGGVPKPQQSNRKPQAHRARALGEFSKNLNRPGGSRGPSCGDPAPEPCEQPSISTSFGPAPRVLLGAVCRRGSAISRGKALRLATGPSRSARPVTRCRETDRKPTFCRRVSGSRVRSLSPSPAATPNRTPKSGGTTGASTRAASRCFMGWLPSRGSVVQN